jgi:hypothetical protein
MKRRQCEARAAFAKEKINHVEQLKDVLGELLRRLCAQKTRHKSIEMKV